MSHGEVSGFDENLLEHDQKIVVVLAGPGRTMIQRGILASCVITQQHTGYLEITCAD